VGRFSKKPCGISTVSASKADAAKEPGLDWLRMSQTNRIAASDRGISLDRYAVVRIPLINDRMHLYRGVAMPGQRVRSTGAVFKNALELSSHYPVQMCVDGQAPTSKAGNLLAANFPLGLADGQPNEWTKRPVISSLGGSEGADRASSRFWLYTNCRRWLDLRIDA
jgi:hypothetical protein